MVVTTRQQWWDWHAIEVVSVSLQAGWEPPLPCRASVGEG